MLQRASRGGGGQLIGGRGRCRASHQQPALAKAGDEQQLEPMLGKLAALSADLGTPQTVLGDNGYFSAANVTACAAAGIEPLLALDRTSHHPSLDFPSGRLRVCGSRI